MTDANADQKISPSPQADDTPEQAVLAEFDAEVINSGPAQYSNKMFSTVLPAGMRITFAEMNPAVPKLAFRSAVFLGYHDVALLIDLLQRQMAVAESLFSQKPEEK